MGRVQSIRKRSFGGQEAATYAQVYFKRDALTMMMLEQDLDKTVRRLLSTTKARQVLKELRTWDGELDEHWKSRAEAIQKAMEQGDPFEYARVFKGLSRLAAKSELRPQDREYLNQSLELLTEELALALGKTPRQARELIHEAGAV